MKKRAHGFVGPFLLHDAKPVIGRLNGPIG